MGKTAESSALNKLCKKLNFYQWSQNIYSAISHIISFMCAIQMQIASEKCCEFQFPIERMHLNNPFLHVATMSRNAK